MRSVPTTSLDLTDPAFGSVPFLEWVRARFLTPVPQVRSWADLCRAEPGLTDAALRLVHAGLLDLRAERSGGAGEPAPPRVEHATWETAPDPVEAAVAEIVGQLHDCIALRHRLPPS